MISQLELIKELKIPLLIIILFKNYLVCCMASSDKNCYHTLISDLLTLSSQKVLFFDVVTAAAKRLS